MHWFPKHVKSMDSFEQRSGDSSSFTNPNKRRRILPVDSIEFSLVRIASGPMLRRCSVSLRPRVSRMPSSKLNKSTVPIEIFSIGIFLFVQKAVSPPLGNEIKFLIGGSEMTIEQKERITSMRNEGYGYTAITKAVGLGKDNVKAFCRVHHLGGVKAQSNARVKPDQDFCLACGKDIIQIPGRKKMKFCSPDCRQAWWNAHPEKVTRKAIYSFTCRTCGNTFTTYGNTGRKYCSHDCYIVDRF